MILRAKTIDLKLTRNLTEKQRINTDLNIKELKEGIIELKSFPRRLVLELTNACNIKCIMCGRDVADFNKTLFDLSYLRKFEEIFYSIEEITLFGWGEPTLHPNFIELLKYFNPYPVRKYFVTNGTRLKYLKDALFDNQVDIMAVSLDGANPLTNSKIRCGSNFDEIISNLSLIEEARIKRKMQLPYVNFVFTAMRSNLHELPDMVRLAHRIGLNEVKVVYLTVFGNKLICESLYNNQIDIQAVFKEAVDLSESLGLEIKLPYIQGEDPAGDNFHRDCFVGWRDFFLGSDGYVRPCQSTAMKLFHYSKYSTFGEMWNSIEYQDFRRRVNNPETMPEECRRCYQSSHANWNRKESFIQIGQEFAPKWGEEKSK
jgi:radical SAM protein with 4Fe4S-binding SPASM domain